MPSEQRLHPSSVLFSFGRSLKALAVPAIVVLVAGRSAGPPVSLWPSGPSVSGGELWTLFLLIPAAVVAVARYLSFRLRYDGTEMVIRTGILFRNERHVPYSRVQNLDAVRNVFHRLLGVTEVRVDTGAGNEPEATISVLPVAAFDDMRRRVFAGRPAAGGLPAAAISTLPPGRTLLDLPLSELLLFGLVDNRGFVVIGAAIGALWQVDLLDRVGRIVLERLNWTDPAAALRAGAGVTSSQIAAAFAAAGAIVVFARLLSMAWAVIRFHGFRLQRVDDDLRMEYGLFTRVAATIPVHRIQTLTIRQAPLQRLSGRLSLGIETAGGHGASSRRGERALLAPIIRPAVADEVVRHLLPDVDAAKLGWLPVHPRAFRRVLNRSLLTVTALALILSPWLGWWTLAVWSVSSIWTALAAGRHVRHLGWAFTDNAVAFRSGWLWKRLTVARSAKIQSVTLVESPFDRRASMGGVRVDTAGAGPQSHRVRIPYLDLETASGLHRRIAARAAATSFRW